MVCKEWIESAIAGRMKLIDMAERKQRPQKLETLGFSTARTGGHLARSMMLHDLQALLSNTAQDANRTELEAAILEENVLGKPTYSSRKKSLRHLIQNYSLDQQKCLFRLLRKFTEEDPSALPRIALVCTFCRDEQLRQSFKLLRGLTPGAALRREQMESHFEQINPGRFSTAMKKSLAQNVMATWRDAQHLKGRATKHRTKPEPLLAASVYAMLAGYLFGLRGEGLLNSVFADLVSPDPALIISHLSAASNRGWLRFRRAGGVVEIDFLPLLTPEEQDIVHESN